MRKIDAMTLAKMLGFVFLALSVSLLGACASSESGAVYSRNQARTVQNVQTGKIEDLKPVKIEGTKSGAGTIGGGVLGGVAGSGVGGGAGRVLAAAAGAVLGAIAGSAVEEGVTREKGVQITIKLDSGRTVSVVQKDDQPLAVGDRVRLISRNGTARVSPY